MEYFLFPSEYEEEVPPLMEEEFDLTFESFEKLTEADLLVAILDREEEKPIFYQIYRLDIEEK